MIAGVITAEMGERLTDLGIVKTYLLDNLVDNESEWLEFLNEVFDYTIRITDSPIGE